ncbi:MAG: dihydrolipoyl dehydrogenase [bacterium]|nr:dihydrolipoyl dehydrogenase [bacterium]
MKTKKLDLAIIGAGSAGMAAYSVARHHTESLALIEGYQYGTTCARVGCMPSKLLIAPAELAHRTSGAEAFGLKLSGPLQIDGPALLKRLRAERDRFVGFVLDSIDEIPAEHKLWGQARFIGPDRLQLSEDLEIQAKAFVVATGSIPVIPPPYRDLGDLLLSTDEIFELEDLPRSVAVIGPGVIGLEIGQALSRLGVEVGLYGLGGLFGPFSDPDMRQLALKAFSEELEIHADAQELKAQRIGQEVEISHLVNGQVQRRRFERVLVTTGRKPRLEGLDLAVTGLKLDKKGRPPLDPKTLQCGDLPIFLAGDASQLRPLLHEAIEQGKQAGKNAALYPKITGGWDRTPLAVVFSDPQIAIVGKGFADLEPGCFAQGEVDFANQGRSRVMLKNLGVLRLYAAMADGKLLGAECFGPDAEHLAHLLAWAIEVDSTVDQLLQRPFYHPVIEEGLRTALRDLRKNLHQPGRTDCPCCPGE